MPSLHLPRPRAHAAARPLRWGLVGVGSIAGRFADANHRFGTQRMTAVASRTPEKAAAFATEHGIEQAFASVDAMLACDDIDIVYIATPHSAHREVAQAALLAGKHVLVEKPIAPTAADARAILALARAQGLLAMEAMWTRYMPQWDVLQQLLADGAIGEVAYAEAAFGSVVPFRPGHRMWEPALAGGALLDLGVYPVSFLTGVLGLPDTVHAVGTTAVTGVDDHAHLTLGVGGAIGSATTSARAALPSTACVAGTAGRIELRAPFILPTTLALTIDNGWRGGAEPLAWTDDALSEPYDAMHYEANAAARCIEQGQLESPVHTHDETIGIISVLEQARAAIGAA